MKTRFAIAFYYLAIGLLTAGAVTIIMKIIFWPPCTDTGKNCVIDSWSVAGLTAAVLGVAATMLAILGALAVAAWWTELNNRVTNLVNRLYNEQVESLNKRVTDQVDLRYNQQVMEIEKQIRSEVLNAYSRKVIDNVV